MKTKLTEIYKEVTELSKIEDDDVLVEKVFENFKDIALFVNLYINNVQGLMYNRDLLDKMHDYIKSSPDTDIAKAYYAIAEIEL